MDLTGLKQNPYLHPDPDLSRVNVHLQLKDLTQIYRNVW